MAPKPPTPAASRPWCEASIHRATDALRVCHIATHNFCKTISPPKRGHGVLLPEKFGSTHRFPPGAKVRLGTMMI
jgi:hypothetical protein